MCSRGHPLCKLHTLKASSSTTDTKIVYRRYASLFFIAGCSSTDNELITLEIVHRYVEQMDKYYGNVCELDIIFNFQKAYFILDELLLAGEMQESSKKNVLKCISQQDSLEEMEVSDTQVPRLLLISRDDFSCLSFLLRISFRHNARVAHFHSQQRWLIYTPSIPGRGKWSYKAHVMLLLLTHWNRTLAISRTV